jgi:hypothetical protein
MLAEAISGIVEAGSRRSNHFLNEKFLPEFDPSTQTVAEWLDKVETGATLYDWDEKTKLYLAVCKLRGNARIWYDQVVAGSQLSWAAFAVAIARQFPGEIDFGTLLAEAVAYKSIPGQDLQTYCFMKVGKLSRLQLDLSEDKLVSFVVHGIHDESIRTTVLAARYRTISDLNRCLSIFAAQNSKIKETKPVAVRDTKPGRFRFSREKESACHGCGKLGHFKMNCPEVKEQGTAPIRRNAKDELTCGFCQKKGHTEERCFRKRNGRRNGKSI